jgi:hypothetical protein
MMGRHRRTHTGNKALQTRSGSPPVTPFVSSQFLQSTGPPRSNATGLRFLLSPSTFSKSFPFEQYSLTLQNPFNVFLVKPTVIRRRPSVCAVVISCNIRNLRADSDFDKAAICRLRTGRDTRSCHGSNTPSDSTCCYGRIDH